MANKGLDKIRQEIEDSERDLKLAKDRKKRLEAEQKKLTKNARTHRLCTRGAMLESHLGDPSILEDEDVSNLLAFAFSQPAVQRKMTSIVLNRRRQAHLNDNEPL